VVDILARTLRLSSDERIFSYWIAVLRQGNGSFRDFIQRGTAGGQV